MLGSIVLLLWLASVGPAFGAEPASQPGDRGAPLKIVFAAVDREPFGDHKGDRKSTRLNSSHSRASRMPSSA